jgi:hypothetical protein
METVETVLQVLAAIAEVPTVTVVLETKVAVAYPVKAVPLVLVQMMAFDPLVVQSPLISDAVSGEPPRTTPVSVLAVPVPPLATGNVPVTSAVSDTDPNEGAPAALP